jgi:hypothetical protein
MKPSSGNLVARLDRADADSETPAYGFASEATSGSGERSTPGWVEDTSRGSVGSDVPRHVTVVINGVKHAETGLAPATSAVVADGAQPHRRQPSNPATILTPPSATLA